MSKKLSRNTNRVVNRKRNQSSLLGNFKEFAKMGNLMFYSSNGVDASDRFFFFKTLLTDYAKNNNPEYTKKANEIGNAAVSALSNSPLGQLNNEDSRVVQLLEQALKILQAGIKYERANENKYIQEKLKKISQVFNNSPLETTAEVVTIKTLLANLEEGFDYTSFINLLNILMQGLDNTKAIYKFEKEHIEEVNKKYLQAKDNYFRQLDGLDKRNLMSFNESNARTGLRSERFDRSAEKDYLLHHTYNVEKTRTNIAAMLKKAMEGTETIDTILARKLTEQLKAIYDDKTLKSQIWEILQKNKAIVNGYDTSAAQIRTTIMVMIEKYMNDNMSTFLTEEIDYGTIADRLEEYFNNNSEESFELNIRGIYDNFGFYGKRLEFFKKQSDLSTDLEQSSEGLYDALVKFRQEVNGKKKKVSELTDKQKYTRNMVFNLQQENGTWNTLIRFMNQLEREAKKFEKINSEFKTAELTFKDIGAKKDDKPIKIVITEKDGKLTISGDNFENSELWKTLGFKSFNPANLKNAIATLKGRMSSLIKKQLNVAFTTAMLSGKEKQARNAVKQALQNLQISIGGPTFNETRQLIAENLDAEAFWSGKLNIKADTITIVAPEFKPDIDINFSNSELQNISDELVSQINQERQKYQKEYMDAIEEDMQQISQSRKFTDYEQLTQNFFKANEVRNQKIQAILKEIPLLDSELESLSDLTEEQSKELLSNYPAQYALLNELENTLYISSTDKTFKHYQNNIGFVGGSIGADIAAQIDNLNILFSKAGMPLTSSEINWLIFAAINNSSLSVVGHQNEDLISTLLGSLAMFALFDEGGAELEILNHSINDSLANISATGIMHLYFVNGTYYPGSFVLQQALDNINLIFEEIKGEVENKSNVSRGVKITNTVSFKDIPNNPHPTGAFNEHPWESVSKTAIGKTNIKVIFLAGLLSVIDGLMNQLSEIEFPQ